MKINSVVAGATPTLNPDEGRSAGADRVARAKAILSGQAPPESPPLTGDKQVDRANAGRQRIRMHTQRSPDRNQQGQFVPEQDPTIQNVVNAAAKAAESDAAAPVVDPSGTEATQPLSPQFAALAKQKRAIQLKEKELLAREAALKTPGENKELLDYKARLKASALKTLQEEGVSYDQLTEELLASSSDSPDLNNLKAEVKALKESLENQNKSQVDRDAQSRAQVLGQMRKEADGLVATGDDFEMVREAGYVPQVIKLIERTFDEKGDVLDVTEALTLVENELLEESLKFAKIKKVQSRLSPAEQQQATQLGGSGKPMRTLTNRDGAHVPVSARERAILAFQGKLKG